MNQRNPKGRTYESKKSQGSNPRSRNEPKKSKNRSHQDPNTYIPSTYVITFAVYSRYIYDHIFSADLYVTVKPHNDRSSKIELTQLLNTVGNTAFFFAFLIM